MSFRWRTVRGDSNSHSTNWWYLLGTRGCLRTTTRTRILINHVVFVRPFFFRVGPVLRTCSSSGHEHTNLTKALPFYRAVLTCLISFLINHSSTFPRTSTPRRNTPPLLSILPRFRTSVLDLSSSVAVSPFNQLPSMLSFPGCFIEQLSRDRRRISLGRLPQLSNDVF